MIKKITNKLVDSGYAVGVRPAVNGEKLITVEEGHPFSLLLPSIRYWYADPIVCEIEGKDYLLIEQFDRFRQVGQIAISTLNNKKGAVSISKPRTIIKEPFHLSFPVLVKDNNTYYIMPESSQDNSLRFYKMNGSPFSWNCVKRIELHDCVDTIHINKENAHYFLTSEQNPENHLYNRLKMFYAKDFLPDFLEDCSDSLMISDYSLVLRNGGPVIENKGKKYRVVQNSRSDFYGYNISIKKIEKLEKGEYLERLEQTISVEEIEIINTDLSKSKHFQFTGMHTYSRSNRFEAVDMSCLYSAPGNVFSKYIKRIKRKRDDETKYR